MAIVMFINKNATLKTTLNYIMKEEKTENKLIAGKDCIAENALEEMNAIKKQYNKYRRRYVLRLQIFDEHHNTGHCNRYWHICI